VKSDNDCLLGLNIKILKNDFIEALDDSKRIADKIADFISSKIMQHVTVRKTGHHGIPKPGKTAPVSRSYTFINKIEGVQPILQFGYQDAIDVIKLNELQHSLLQRLSIAIKHHSSGCPVEALKEIYAIIENDRTFPNFDKLHGLRQVFTHSPRQSNRPYSREAIDNFKRYFNESTFDYLKYEPLSFLIIPDMNSQKTKLKLSELVSQFLVELKSYLECKFNFTNPL
jgi:hypothetical protein